MRPFHTTWYTAPFAHLDRTESVQMCDMHLVIFMAKKYKPEYHIASRPTVTLYLHTPAITPNISGADADTKFGRTTVHK